MDPFRFFLDKIFYLRLPFICPPNELEHHISITYIKQLSLMQLHAEGTLYECNYCIILH